MKSTVDSKRFKTCLYFGDAQNASAGGNLQKKFGMQIL